MPKPFDLPIVVGANVEKAKAALGKALATFKEVVLDLGMVVSSRDCQQFHREREGALVGYRMTMRPFTVCPLLT